MATSSYAKSLLGGLGADVRAAFARVFDYVFEGNLRFGPVDHQQRTENFAGIYLRSTTASTAGDEFTVAHGLPTKPRVMWQVLDPQAVNSQVVRLAVSRAADDKRVYLTSSDTGAAITLYVEA